jgi:hypothetical protein
MLAGAPAAAQNLPVEVPRDAVTVLDTRSYWRWFEVSRTPTVTKDGETKPLPGTYVDGPEPPPTWMQPGFDDRAWPRAPGQSFPRLIFSKLHLGAACLRGKFHCKDLRGVGWRPTLYLTATFRGGIVVYLNGREVARAGLPEGKLSPTTPALPYPDDLFLTKDGKTFIFPSGSQSAKRIQAGDEDLARRYEERDRVLPSVKIGAGLLRTGTNVLAVEVHRSPYHPTATSWWAQNGAGRWVPCHLPELRLAVSGKGLTPNVARPRSKKVWRPDGRGQMWTQSSQVWTVDRNNRIALYDYGDPNEPLGPVRLVGARNGEFSGQIAVGWDRPIKNLKAEASDLKQAGGDAVIRADHVRVRYLKLVHYGYNAQYWYDQIIEDPPAEIPVHKSSGGATGGVFVSVAVPRDAAPGDYAGTVTVSFEGMEPAEVPVRLSVADWTLPDPPAYGAYAGIYQSPETLSMHYKVPMWSEKHWDLIEQSFRLLGHVGNDFVHVPIINRSQTGNDAGWVCWVRKKDGSFGYDFTVFDRYMALVKTYLKQPDFICLHVWRSPIYNPTPTMSKPHFVTELDPKSGKKTPLRVPAYGTKESLAFWKPVMLAIKKRLARLDLEKSICLGVLIENRLPSKLTEFHDILPEAGWVKGCHVPTTANHPVRMKGGSSIVLQEHAYPTRIRDPRKSLPAIWERGRVGARFYRGNAERRDLQDYRILCERNMYYGSNGFGRVGLDFWPVRKARGRRRFVYQRWPESSSAQRGVYVFRLAWPGPNGAEPTLRLEAIREGLQETEAAILIGEAQARHADRLGPELARRCRDILVRRVQYCIERTHQPWGPVFIHVNHRGWQDLNAELFDAAADVAAALRR